MSLGYLVIALWIVFALYWIAAAGFAKPSLTHPGPPYFLIPLLACDFLLIFPVIGTTPLWDFPITGLALTICGLLYAAWARAILGTNWSGDLTIQRNHELVDQGPYRHHRHPIYLGILLAFFSTGLFIGEVRGYVAPVLALVAFVWKARDEERALTETFPDTYPAYKARTHW